MFFVAFAIKHVHVVIKFLLITGYVSGPMQDSGIQKWTIRVPFGVHPTCASVLGWAWTGQDMGNPFVRFLGPLLSESISHLSRHTALLTTS